MKSIAVISGKGGTGKTTMSLLHSQQLALEGKRVLLVDCDMSTHGATYFLYSECSNWNEEKKCYLPKENIPTVSRIMIEREGVVLGEPAKIKKNFDFIPSCLEFKPIEEHMKEAKKPVNEQWDRYYDNFENYIKTINKKYDVVIYDCQAAFSFLTEKVVELSDYNCLVPLELDGVCASSWKVLCAKLGLIYTTDDGNHIAGKLKEEHCGKISILFNKLGDNEKSTDFKNQDFLKDFGRLTNFFSHDSIRKGFQKNKLPKFDKLPAYLRIATRLNSKAILKNESNNFDTSVGTFNKIDYDAEDTKELQKEINVAKKRLQQKNNDTSIYMFWAVFVHVVTLFTIGATAFSYALHWEVLFSFTLMIFTLATVICSVLVFSYTKNRVSEIRGNIRKIESEIEFLRSFVED